MIKSKRPRPRVSQVKPLPAPVGGWNARDAISNMPELDAVQLDNFFPSTYDVMLRKGSSAQATGITGTVETLAAYNSQTTSYLFAANTTDIYDATSTGAVGAPVVTGQSSGRWQHVNFGVPGGANWLLMVNGVDDMQGFDGATWMAINSGSTPAITGVPTSSIIHINVFKRRIWLIEKESTKAWYLPTDSIAGAASSFDVGPLFTMGGYLMAMGTWTLDAGEGSDDHAVFISSKGQIAVYKGTDPSSPTTFALIGVYNLGSPIGRRCFIKFGGDLLLITRDGAFPLSKALQSDRLDVTSAVTNKIHQALSDAASLYFGLFGWQLQSFPDANMLILNVPKSSTESVQFVMNTITGSWCQFTGWNAACWEIFNDEIYFGTDGAVNKAWTGYLDGAVPIVGEVITAFSYFGTASMLKRWTMVRPTLTFDSIPSLTMGLNIDFDTSTPVGTPSFSIFPGLWDAGLWDVAIWSGGTNVQRGWQTVYGLGYAAALHMKATGVNFRWQSIDYVFEAGSGIV